MPANPDRIHWSEYCDTLPDLAARFGVFPISVNVPRQHRMKFCASVELLEGDDGSALILGRASAPIQQANLARTAGARGSAIVITSLVRGSVRIDGPGQDPQAFGPDDIFVSDYSSPARMSWGPHVAAFLVIPSHTIHPAPAAGDIPLFRSHRSGVGALFAAHLHGLAAVGANLSTMERTASLQAARIMALSLLATPPIPYAEDDENALTALFLLARAYLQRHIARTDLQVQHITAALHCSRSQLYRAFASKDTSVAAELREMRLQHARTRLETTGVKAGIATIADECGYGDPSAFGKAFRRRFGAAPRDWIDSPNLPKPAETVVRA